MDYEPNYSRKHIHFVTNALPSWHHLLDTDESVTSILDLGAGGGRNSIYLRPIYPQATLVPFDLSLIRCDACRRVVDASITCGNSMALSFQDNSFDLVISTQVIEHVPDDVTFVKEIERVLKPGGTAIISSVLKKKFGWYFYRNDKGEWMLDPTHVREYRSVNEYTSLFVDLFSSVSVNLDSYRFSVGRFIYRLLVKIGVIRKPDAKIFIESRWVKIFEEWQIPVPRYQDITVVVKK